MPLQGLKKNHLPAWSYSVKAGFAINAKNKSTIGTLSHIGFSVYDCWALAVPSKKRPKKKMVIKVQIEN